MKKDKNVTEMSSASVFSEKKASKMALMKPRNPLIDSDDEEEIIVTAQTPKAPAVTKQDLIYGIKPSEEKKLGGINH